MKPVKEMTLKEKLSFLTFLEESEETYFSEYNNELTLLSSDEDKNIRQKAITLLWDDPCPQYMEILLKTAASDPEIEVRCKAILGLGRYIYEGMEFSFNESLEDLELDAIEQEMFEDSISQEDYQKVKNFLLEMYKNSGKSLDERRFALEAISYSVEEEIQEIIREAYNSPQRMMKLSAIFAMGRNGLLCWKNILLQELENEDPLILCEAIKAVGEMALSEAGKRILDLTYAKDPEITKAAIWTLAQTGWQGAYERLDELSRIRNKEIRELAEMALEEWHIINSSSEEEEFL